MGEHGTLYSSNPVYILMMRNSRGKLFVYVAVLGVLCFIVFLLSSTHNNLKELEGVNEKCQQQRDSLSAQLQVVYEHKNRLEKSLQQEKTDHKHTKEANEKQASDLENKLQKEKDELHKLENKVSQLKSSYAELEEEKSQSEHVLRQQLKAVQTQKDAEIEKLQSHISDLLAEKEKLEVQNNAFGWKLEQHTSELNLCHLQLQQSIAELHTCEEQRKANVWSTINDKGYSKPSLLFNNTKDAEKIEKPALPKDNAINNEIIAQPQDNDVFRDNQHLKDTEIKTVNLTASPAHEKHSLLEKPHIMPGNNIGDGVLPKPMELNMGSKDMDAALEVTDSKKGEKHIPVVDPLENHIGERDVNGVAHPVIPEKRAGEMNNMIPNLNPQMDNHPQVVPPNLENVEEKDDHAGERGEDGIQNKTRRAVSEYKHSYSNIDGKPQVEGPVLGQQNGHAKEFPLQPDNNDIAAQMQDMMNKSPGDVNNAAEQNVIGLPPHFAPVDTNKNQLKNENGFLHRGHDGHHLIDEKNYEEDDEDDRDNEEPPNGLAPVLKANNNQLQDNDFDDQDNQDNGDNAKEEEGVVVAPK